MTSEYIYTSPEDAEEAIYNEAMLYSKSLSGIQGSVVPRFLGLFVGTYESSNEKYWLMLMEDGGRSMENFRVFTDGER